MAGICNLCGLPDELCICQEIAKEQQKATISVERRRYGKMVTIVQGIDDSAIDLGELAKILKEHVPVEERSRIAPLSYRATTSERLLRS